MANTLWEIHPSPSKFGDVVANLYNELQKTIAPREEFCERITASLREWAAYWTESGRMATGLDNWIRTGDYARSPPPLTRRQTSSLADEIAKL